MKRFLIRQVFPRLFGLLYLLSLCGTAMAAQDNTPVPDGEHSYQEFRATISSFPYSAPSERKRRILTRYPRLRIGMTKHQVAELLGKPDYSQLTFGPKGPGEHWNGSFWTYHLYMRDDNGNEFDPALYVGFGTDGLVDWAAPSGIGSLSKLGH